MIISLYWLQSINHNLKCFFYSKTTKNRNNFVAGFKFMYLIYNPGGNECLLTYIICLFEYKKGCFSHEMQVIDYILILILSHLLEFFMIMVFLKILFNIPPYNFTSLYSLKHLTSFYDLVPLTKVSRTCLTFCILGIIHFINPHQRSKQRSVDELLSFMTFITVYRKCCQSPMYSPYHLNICFILFIITMISSVMVIAALLFL